MKAPADKAPETWLPGRGFTLVEVMVALAIVAFGLTALFTTTTQSVRGSSYLREKTLAQWIALNRISEARLEGQPPSDEEMSGEIDFAGETWRWELKTLETAVRGIVRLEARAALVDSAADSWPGFATGFMGNALAPPGGPDLNWLGNAPAGSSPGQTPPENGQPRAEPGPPPQDPTPVPEETQ